MSKCKECKEEARYAVIITKADGNQEVKQLCEDHKTIAEQDAKDKGLRFQLIQGGKVV